MAETMNMMEISVDRFINEIKMDLEDENYEPVIGIGKSGVGKTMSIYELTQKLGIGFCELRLVCLTEIDLLGIPTIEEGRTTYAANALLPHADRDGEEGILVLDEITSCNSTIRAAAYQLLDSKRALGNYKLPPKWKVVGLGNGVDDGGVYSGMEAAFLSRATCYRIEPNLDSWKKWAIANKVNPSIIAYLNFDASKLHDLDTNEMVSVFPCPRSWTALSKKLNARELRNGGSPLPLEQVELYAAGTIGAKEAATFAGFYEYKKSTLDAKDIIAGKLNGKDVKSLQPEVIYLVIQQLVREVSDVLTAGKLGDASFSEESVVKTSNAIKWLIQASEVKLDYSLTGLRDLKDGCEDFRTLILEDPKFDTICPEFMEFSLKNSLIFS